MDTTSHVLAAQAAATSGLVGVNFFIAVGALAYAVYYERKKDDHQWPDMARGAIVITLVFVCFPALAVALGAGLNTVVDSIVEGVKNIKFES